MNFELIEINKIDSYQAENETVYDITVEDDHSFCVNDGIIVHNSVCTTRLVAGVGIPQFSCVLDCVKEADKFNVFVCSDGGCRTPGDVVKAFGAGASMVMIGSMLSGCDECEGDWTYDADGKKTHLKFYGMSSKEAMEKYHSSVADYRASEGRCVTVEYKGLVKDTINQILGGLRSACSYTNSFSLKEFPEKVSFVRCNKTHDHI
jgi:GMP reductase